MLTNLGAVAHWGSGGTPSRRNPDFFSGTIPWIKTGELGDKFIHHASESISEEAINKSSAKIFPAGSVGIAMYGATIGKLSIFGINASTNQACAVANPKDGVLFNEFLYYYLLSERRALIDSGKGGAQPNISQGILKEWPIALPPIAIQYRIVAKIEELFSELDKGIESLKTSREQLKVYRQAVLKHAFEGKLTAKWREENKAKLESPELLLARIQQAKKLLHQEQLEVWMQEIKEWETKSKESKKPTKPRQVTKELIVSSEDLLNYPVLPLSWRWVTMNELISGLPRSMQSGPFGSNLKHSEFKKSGRLVIGIDNVKDGFFSSGNENRISEKKFKELIKYEARPGDLLITVMASLGRTCVIPRDIERAIITKHVYRISMDQEFLHPEFYNYLLQSHTMSRIRMLANAQGQTRPGLNGAIIRELPVPLCDTAEQLKIVEYIEEKLSELSWFENEITSALKRSEVLRQSILKEAFSGQLVPQNTSDEPVSKLLERIHRENANKNTLKNQIKRKKSA